MTRYQFFRLKEIGRQYEEFVASLASGHDTIPMIKRISIVRDCTRSEFINQIARDWNLSTDSVMADQVNDLLFGLLYEGDIHFVFLARPSEGFNPPDWMLQALIDVGDDGSWDDITDIGTLATITVLCAF